MALPEHETRLDEADLAKLLASGVGWAHEGETLTKTFHCKGWKRAIAFVDRIAAAADELDHHPDIHVERYRHVRVVTTTFATGKLSDADVALARQIDEAFATGPA